ncbi:MAG: hypothetical protein NTZ35_10845 [Ignavibacteriales bacterium]|nr:hypothetical protein [Ignavibacteriales bacterium]
MDTSVLIWFVIFIIAMVLFFGTAVVIAVIGVRDLKDLLSGSTTKE